MTQRFRFALALGVATACALGLVGAPHAHAGQPADAWAVETGAVDARWTPWLGCWALWQEQFDGPHRLREAERDGIVDRTSVCVTPAAPGVLLRAEAGGRLLVERHLVADGVRRDIDADGCQGWERSEWSTDGHRLFTRGEVHCDDEPVRTVTGISLMASASSWVDIQLVRMGERDQLEVRRYSPMTPAETHARLSASGVDLEPAAIRQARREAADAPALADIMEASTRSAPRVVEALLVETEPDLDVDAEALIALDDAGIDHGVIDLVVALSYPDQFVVERRGTGGSWSSGTGTADWLSPWSSPGLSAVDPIWYSSLYPYYVTPLGYGSWGRGVRPYLYGAAGSPFVVLPAIPDDEAATGRAYRGRGYTRVRPRDVSVPDQVQPRGGSAVSGRGGSRTGASSGGGGATRGGYTSGGDGGDGGRSGGRRAVPRSRN